MHNREVSHKSSTTSLTATQH